MNLVDRYFESGVEVPNRGGSRHLLICKICSSLVLLDSTAGHMDWHNTQRRFGTRSAGA